VKVELARPLIKKMSVVTVERAGILKLRTLHMVNTNMWHHPNYYKELAKKRKEFERQLEQEGKENEASSNKQQASSNKRQAIEQEGHEDS
jgi:hypothetical protein